MAAKKKDGEGATPGTVDQKPEEQATLAEQAETGPKPGTGDALPGEGAAPAVSEKNSADTAPPASSENPASETPPALETLKPTAVASGSEQIAETAGAVELASPRMDPPLERLEVLADRHRVPTWQQASLCRFMDWADGKVVSNAEYLDALGKLKSRRVGGGRMG